MTRSKGKKQHIQQRKFAVMDIEATCQEKGKIRPQEVIELPILLIDPEADSKLIDTFHVYIKPTMNPQLTDFCKELTGITQEQVDEGIHVTEAITKATEWMTKHLGDKIPLVCTCGDWDVLHLKEELSRHNYPPPIWMETWCNIKKAAGGGTMMQMLEILRINHEGRHHSGIDDTKNIARIVIALYEDGKKIKPTW